VTRAHDRSRPKESVRSRCAGLAGAQHGRSDKARPRRSKLCCGHIAVAWPEQCCGVCLPTRLRADRHDRYPSRHCPPATQGDAACRGCLRAPVPAVLSRAEFGPDTARKNYLARRSGRSGAV